MATRPMHSGTPAVQAAGSWGTSVCRQPPAEQGMPRAEAQGTWAPRNTGCRRQGTGRRGTLTSRDTVRRGMRARGRGTAAVAQPQQRPLRSSAAAGLRGTRPGAACSSRLGR